MVSRLESLLALLNDILDLAKIEAGKLEIETVEFDLEEVTRGACAAFMAMAEQKGLTFSLKAEPDAGRRWGDPTRLRQVLANLVGNAVKFTETGGIDVVVRTGDDAIECRVSDTGIGMARDVVEKLFTKFTQADISTTRRFGGTGLGLAICRELIELMGGEIEVETSPGVGSSFTFALPFARGGPSVAGNARCDHGQSRALRVLAAEDNATNRLVLRTLLEQAGVEIVVVEDGSAAVDACAASSWDAILMDVQMPVMDGPTAASEIRRRERETGRARTPIIALTANAMTHQAAEYLTYGMDAVVAKPIEVEALLTTLSRVVAGAAANGEASDRLRAEGGGDQGPPGR